MSTPESLRYLPAMFATCMLFQVIYVLCLGLRLVFPDLNGHGLVLGLLPGFELLDFKNFVFGLIVSGAYGWLVAAVFVFFYNRWPGFARLVFGRRFANP